MEQDPLTGRLCRFDPFEFHRAYGVCVLRKKVEGRIVYVNRKHGWFIAEWNDGRNSQKVSFRFSDIGRTVKLI